MRTPCPQCGHALWSEVRRKGAFRFVVYFEDDARSVTYTAQIRTCPECAADLLGHAIDPNRSQPPRGLP